MSIRLIVKAGEHSRVQCPASVLVEDSSLIGKTLVLTSEDTQESIPCQTEEVEGKLRISWVLSELPAGTQKTFLLNEGDEAAPAVVLQQDPGKIDVSIAEEEFTSLHFGSRWARPFLHPVIGPYGDPMTRAYPIVEDVEGETQDHPHHKSFWVAWGEVNGSDNWSENEKGHGRQEVTKLQDVCSGSAFGRIALTCDWLSETGVKQLEEEREFIFHNGAKNARIVDLQVTFRATAGPVTFGDTKEGGICSIRVASSMDASGDGTIVNSYGGTNEAETWGKRAQWCDYVGPVEGKTVGIAILDHPDNFRYPTYWHVRNYGLMTANPFGLSHFLKGKDISGTYTLQAGKELTFRYRVIFHAGTTKEAAIAEKYHDFINPPQISVER